MRTAAVDAATCSVAVKHTHPSIANTSGNTDNTDNTSNTKNRGAGFGTVCWAAGPMLALAVAWRGRCCWGARCIRAQPPGRRWLLRGKPHWALVGVAVLLGMDSGGGACVSVCVGVAQCLGRNQVCSTTLVSTRM